MYCHVDDNKIVLKKNGKSFHWAGKLLNKECINRAAELYKKQQHLIQESNIFVILFST